MVSKAKSTRFSTRLNMRRPLNTSIYRRPSLPMGTRRRRWIIAGAGFIFLVIFLFVGNGYWHTLENKRKVKALELRIEEQRRLNEQMRERIKGLKSGDPMILEQEARDHGFIRKGEKVYIIGPEPEKTDGD